MPHETDIPDPETVKPSWKTRLSLSRFNGTIFGKIAYRVFRLTGEFTAIILGTAFLWFTTLNVIAAQRSLDVSHFSDNVGIWFAEAFDGNAAEIANIRLNWIASENAIELLSKDITIKDKNQTTIQTLEDSRIAFDFPKLLSGQFVTTRAELTGGELTWYRDENGVITLGVGNPENFRTFAPLMVSDPNDENTGTPGFGRLQSLIVNKGLIHFVDDYWGTKLDLTEATVSVLRADQIVDFQFSAEVQPQIEGADIGELSGKFLVSNDGVEASGSVSLINVRPDQLAPENGPFKPLSMVRAPAEMIFTITRDSDQDIRQYELELGEGAITIAGRDEPFDLIHLDVSHDALSGGYSVQELLLDSRKYFAEARGELLLKGEGIWGATINVDQARVDLTSIFDDPFEIEDFVFAGEVDLNNREISASDLKIDLGGYQIQSALALAMTDDNSLKSFKTNGSIEGEFTQKELLSLWPSEIGLGAREWIERSILSGELSNLKFDVDIPGSAIREKALLDEHVRLSFDASDAVVKYISTMTPLENASGSGVLQGNRLDFDLTSGNVGRLQVESGRVEIPRLNPKGGDFTIDVKGRGPVGDMMVLIDQKPFEFASRYGVDPSLFDGQGQIDMRITRPLLVNFDQSRITYDVDGSFENVKAPFQFAGKSIENGNVKMVADRHGMTLSGPVTLGGWNAVLDWKESFAADRGPTQIRLEGEVDRDALDGFGIGFRGNLGGSTKVVIDAEGQGTEVQNATISGDLTNTELTFGDYWHKPVGAPGQFSSSVNRGVKNLIQISDVSVTAPGLSILGAVDLNDDLQFLSLELPEVKIDGLVNGQLTAKPTANRDRIDVELKGALLDLSDAVTRSIRAERNELFIPLSLSADLERLALNEAYILAPGRIAMDHNGIGVERFELSGQSDGREMSARLTPHADSAQRNLLVHIPDAAKATQAFTGTNNVRSGQVLLTGILPPVGEEGRLTGTFEISDFKLVDAPVFARMLSMASLKGLTDLMGGDGVHFNKLTIPYGFEDGRLDIDEARASGAALGMTGDGYVDLKNRVVDLDGVLVPAYTANSALGSIPVIGDIFVGKKGEGIFALSYAVKGPFKQTQIGVNPFSALTPGFLRQIFEPNRPDNNNEAEAPNSNE